MKAITRVKYGNPDVLSIQNVPIPKHRENEILIKTHCTTVNRTDCAILKADPFVMRFFTGLFKPKDLIPGTDFSGEVIEIGSQVTKFKKGDRVFGFQDQGIQSQAEYFVIDEKLGLEIIPENVSYSSAAAAIEGAHYAYNIIKHLGVSGGEKTLINGSTGAIGTALIQFLKHFQTEVSVVGNTKNIQLLQQLGALQVFDYQTEDFTKSTDTYNIIIDTVSSSSFGKVKHLLTEDGKYCSTELGPRAENLYLPIITKLFGRQKVVFPVPGQINRSIELVKKLLSSGEFKPVIEKEYKMDVIQEVYRYVLSAQKTGNVVVNF